VTRAQRIAIDDASERMHRFAPLLARLFFELHGSAGHISSPLLAAATLAAPLGFAGDPASLFVKADHMLPVGGSIKARGGAHAVFEIAERVGGFPTPEQLSAQRMRLASHEVSAGSTGNLGMSIGIFAAALGFRTVVHMSSHAREWKKNRLRAQGVCVVEHEGDYLQTLARGRLPAKGQAMRHFIDDEDSETLLYGYATAARELGAQLVTAGRIVDAQHPLFVYIPCGVGGAPAGISLGLSALFGRNVHCVYAEPLEAPCMLLALASGDAGSSVYDVGLSGITHADGLAVPRASQFAARVSRHVAEGIYTISDDTLLEHLRLAYEVLGLRLEPSAAAGFEGAVRFSGEPGHGHKNSTHVVWTTGGGFVPDDDFAGYLQHASP
jgi:D-serine dehydratase